MIYENINDHVPETESNIRAIKERFRIAYYMLPHKKIPRIMICHLAMNVAQNLYRFPANGGVLDNYIPPMIMSQRNWDYKKHCQV